MKKYKLWAIGLTALVLCLFCTGCGSTLVENSEIYFSNTRDILHTLFSDGEIEVTGNTEVTKTKPDAVPLDAPTNFTIDADGKYSFAGVDDAQYYLLYFCAPDATSDEDSFIYSSAPIEADGSETYSGNASDAFKYAFGEYLAKVYAFPDLTDATRSMSAAATAPYTYSGAQSDPQLYYYWNTFDGTMGVQIANMGEYLYEAYPDRVDVTFTNVDDSNDTVTLSIEEISESNYGGVTDALARDATYTVTAVATSTNAFVTNPTSGTTTVSEGLTLDGNHIFTDGYSYTDGFANNIFNWPIMAERFDLANGGEAGHSMGMGGRPSPFDATPAAAVTEGSAYSFTLQAGNFAAGTLELYPDGTFLANETGGGPVNASHIGGTWVDNGDGTAILNYDHSTLVIE